MLINGEPNFLETGFSIGIKGKNDEYIYKPYTNVNSLYKDDLNFKYDSIQDYFSETITIPANTYDLERKWNSINFLTIKASNDFAGLMPAFNLKLNNNNSQVLNFNEFVHLQFSEPITKFYISNPGPESIHLTITYIKSNYTTGKIFNNFYYKTDSLLYWDIKHNLGIIPKYTFLSNQDTIVNPEHTITYEDANRLVLKFTEPYKGYIYFTNDYTFEQSIFQTEWVIDHNLNKIPNILIVDTNDSPITKLATITYIDTKKIILTFEQERAGKVFLY